MKIKPVLTLSMNVMLLLMVKLPFRGTRFASSDVKLNPSTRPLVMFNSFWITSEVNCVLVGSLPSLVFISDLIGIPSILSAIHFRIWNKNSKPIDVSCYLGRSDFLQYPSFRSTFSSL